MGELMTQSCRWRPVEIGKSGLSPMLAIDPERSVGALVTMSESLSNSNAALTFDDQNPRFSTRMRNMLTSNPCEKHVANHQCHDAFDA